MAAKKVARRKSAPRGGYSPGNKTVSQLKQPPDLPGIGAKAPAKKATSKKKRHIRSA